MIDNLEIIIPLLTFDSEDDFYHLQIIKRKKEHTELGKNSYIVKTYYISSLVYLTAKLPEIMHLCDYHDARGCINLNKRSFEKTAFHALKKITDQILNKDYRSCRKAYESVCGTSVCGNEKRWIIDIDDLDVCLVDKIRNDIKNCMPNRREDKVIAKLPTKNGYHLITSPFNIEEFKQFWPNIDIHKNNPTILYIP